MQTEVELPNMYLVLSWIGQEGDRKPKETELLRQYELEHAPDRPLAKNTSSLFARSRFQPENDMIFRPKHDPDTPPPAWY